MIKKFFVLINILFIIHCFAGSHEKDNPSVKITIYSPTECYTVLKELGEGAFGKVYAVENSSGERFALKSYKSQKKTHLKDHPLANAQREYERGLLLNHSNIVKVFDLFKDDSDEHGIYLVLELIEGQTINGLPKGSLLINQSLNSALQLVDALRYALSQDFLYLDLHPQNIMLTDSCDTMIIDLASFFSFEELINFAKKERVNHEEDPETTKIVESSPQEPIARDKKLRHFFLQHPKLHGKIKEKIKKREQRKAKQKIKKEEKKRAATKKNDQEQEELDLNALSPLLKHYYFDSITEICGFLITKSNLSRDEKIDLRIHLKKLSWNHSEDIEDGLNVSIDDYFDQLIDILKS